MALVYLSLICSLSLCSVNNGASLVTQSLKNQPTVQEMRFDPWVRKTPRRKEMATHSSILAWGSQWIPGRLAGCRLQYMGWQKSRTWLSNCITITPVNNMAGYRILSWKSFSLRIWRHFSEAFSFPLLLLKKPDSWSFMWSLFFYLWLLYGLLLTPSFWSS